VRRFELASAPEFPWKEQFPLILTSVHGYREAVARGRKARASKLDFSPG